MGNDTDRPNQVRLPYVAPAIKKYGSVATVTNAADMAGDFDGGPKAART